MPTQTFITVLERITTKLQEALEGITLTNGYTVDATVVRNQPTDGTPTSDGLVVLIVGDSEEDEEKLFQFHCLTQSYDIICTRIQSDTNETPVETLVMQIASDVIRAATADIRQGGLAHDTLVGAPTFDYLSAGANAGFVTVPVTVHYRTYFNNPFRSAYED